MRNYKKEYERYHSKPEQKVRRAARNAARRLLKDRKGIKGKDVHHKDNNPLNNDKKNLSLVTQRYNRREPRLREGIDADAMIDLMQKYLLSKNNAEKKALLKQINKYQKKMGLKVTELFLKFAEDMGSTTGAHIAGTGDDNTVHTKPKKKVKRRVSLIKSMARK